ncbi:hypothetical protein ACQFX9_13005 [Aliinostoc sp. HNIBRCY26]|uniref:hypothetical protein n=1 Tax=Aliinostoc sp. HNIBRCY26 TaxID=3418997 RepID=UPI003CFE300E
MNLVIPLALARIMAAIVPKLSPSKSTDNGGRSHQQLDLFQKSDRSHLSLQIQKAIADRLN